MPMRWMISQLEAACMLGSTENHTTVYGYWIIINYYLIIIIFLLHDAVEGETIFPYNSILNAPHSCCCNRMWAVFLSFTCIL